jgi:hypothetical protein
VIQKALVKMGCRDASCGQGIAYELARGELVVTLRLDSWLQRAAFIAECKAYLREKGDTSFRVDFREDSVEVWRGPSSPATYCSAPTEAEAWAKAVLSVAEAQG